MGDEWEGDERRKTVQLVDTSHALTEEDLRDLKALASSYRAARWLVAGIIAATGVLGLDRIAAWLKH